jgi:hypothetical protein
MREYLSHASLAWLEGDLDVLLLHALLGLG